MSDVVKMVSTLKKDRVPYSYPYGGITDGTVMCARCHEFVTGCGLCAGEVVALIPAPKEDVKRYGYS